MQAPAGAASSMGASVPFFEAAEAFEGARLGTVFKLGHLGLGYYLDPHQTLVPEVREKLPEKWRNATLREERLRVDAAVGAGISLEHSEFGFVVEGVDPEPGQQLQPGEVIVAMEGRLLVGLSAPQMQASFAKRRVDGARLHIANLAEVTKLSKRDPSIVECWDAQHQHTYYFHKKTGKTSWVEEELVAHGATGSGEAASSAGPGAPPAAPPVDLANFLIHGFAKPKEQPPKKKQKVAKDKDKEKDAATLSKDESDLARAERQRWEEWNSGGSGGYTEMFLNRYKGCQSNPGKKKDDKRLKGSVGPGNGMEYLAKWTGSKNSFN